MRRGLLVPVLAVLLAATTWLVGWWSVPVVALIVGLWRRDTWPVTLAAVLAWTALLVFDVSSGRFRALAVSVGGVMGLPTAAPLIATLVFVALLAASAATLGAFIRLAVMSARKGVVA